MIMEKPVPKHRLVDSPLTVAALYHFALLDNLDQKRRGLLDICDKNEILGTFLLAEEGINGTVAGGSEAINLVVDYICSWTEVEKIDVKFSESSARNFRRMKVKIKKEIVTMGTDNVDPLNESGEYIEPHDWNEFISQDGVMLIDTRNNYEISMGKFKDAVNPNTDSFSDFPSWADNLSNSEDKPKKIAMYCTGGIRCEKATVYMKQVGFEKVYHLRGGILKYLEEIPETASMWEGECFVFDDRVSLTHGLNEGEYILCYGCQQPVSAYDCLSPLYEEGVSCLQCYGKLSESQTANSRERQKQIQLAYDRGEKHMGRKLSLKNRSKKLP